MAKTDFTTTVDLPVKATLILKTEDDREVPVTPKVLKGFGYRDTSAVMMRFRTQLARALDLRDADGELDTDLDSLPEGLRPIAYMVDCALYYDHDFDYSSEPDNPENDDTRNNNEMIAALRALVAPANA